ncbi:MAG: radical SAM protein [Deltaproteobacteria bacterium]
MGLVSGLQRRIESRFKAAVAKAGGDAALMAALGKVISRPGVAEHLWGEGEMFLVKAALFMAGVRVDPSASEGVGTVWKEDLGQRHYDPDARRPRGPAVPHGIKMPHGYFMPLTIRPDAPFLLRRDGGQLYLYLDELRLFPVELERRPAFYARDTSTGVPMRHVGVHRLERQVLCEFNAYCKFFSERTACLFCGIVSERPLLSRRYGGHFAASPEEIAEVVEAAYAEGISEMQLTGGVLPGQVEVGYFLEVGRAMQRRLGVKVVAGSQAVLAPPPRLEDLDALHDAGWEGVAMNLEVFDPRLWPGIVPGKAALMSQERWLESLVHAAAVFGKGNVASVLVAGLEPMRSHLAGVEWLAERGIHGVPIPFTPAPASALEGFQSPTAAWHIEATAKVLDIWERHGLEADRHSSAGLHYADLARMRAHLRAEKAARPDRDFARDLRHQLAIEGKLPLA